MIPTSVRASFNPLIRPYLVLYVGLTLLATVIGAPLAVVWFCGAGQWWARHYFDKLECELGPTALRFRKGILFQTEVTIPLENIQDVTFIEGPLLKSYHLSILKFETAGQSAGQAHAMRLIGIIDAHDFRSQILQGREAARRAHAAPPAATAGDAQVLQALKDIQARLGEIVGLMRKA